jgi:hypothetical protein
MDFDVLRSSRRAGRGHRHRAVVTVQVGVMGPRWGIDPSETGCLLR